MTKTMNKNIKELLDWLESHNKNYTKEQYHAILDLREKIESLCEWLDKAQIHTGEAYNFLYDLNLDTGDGADARNEADSSLTCLYNAQTELKGE